jgi:hypothetical protein
MVTRKGLPPTRDRDTTTSLTPSLGTTVIVDGATLLWDRDDPNKRNPYRFPNHDVRLFYGETYGGSQSLKKRIMNAWGMCMLWGR